MTPTKDGLSVEVFFSVCEDGENTEFSWLIDPKTYPFNNPLTATTSTTATTTASSSSSKPSIPTHPHLASAPMTIRALRAYLRTLSPTDLTTWRKQARVPGTVAHAQCHRILRDNVHKLTRSQVIVIALSLSFPFGCSCRDALAFVPLSLHIGKVRSFPPSLTPIFNNHLPLTRDHVN